jgi:hypothetical protein
MFLSQCTGSVTGNTIVKNGSAVDFDEDITFANNIVAFNDFGIGHGTGPCTMANNCVYGNTGGDYYGTPGDHDINVDPLMVDLVNDDYHLNANSPCRDAAKLQYVYGLYDMDMEPRIADYNADIGVDEVAGCGRVDLRLTPDVQRTQTGNQVRFVAHVFTYYETELISPDQADSLSLSQTARTSRGLSMARQDTGRPIPMATSTCSYPDPRLDK